MVCNHQCNTRACFEIYRNQLSWLGSEKRQMENSEYLLWDREYNIISIKKNEVPSLDIYYTIDNNDYEQSIKWDPESTSNRTDLTLRWNNTEEKFIANWEIR